MTGVVEVNGTGHGDSGAGSSVVIGPSQMNHFGLRSVLLTMGEAASEPLTPTGRCRGCAHG